MNSKITQRQIGQRLAELRKLKGLAQKELATLIGISRSSLTQIELGKRSLSAIEMLQFASHLGFSMDAFLGKDFSVEIKLEEHESRDEMKDMRISVPDLNVKKIKNILLYILERCAGKPNVGETVLYKLLYFSDFNYYELYEEHLSGARYRKLPFGPVPKKIDSVINAMIKEGQLQRINTVYHDFPQKRYLPLEKADLTTLKASEKDVIDKVIDQFSDWSARGISDYSHKDMPWLATQAGKEINYELVFYRETPYSVRNYIEEDGL